MTTSDEYRKFANECARYAAEAGKDDDRAAFLGLVQDWTFAAMATDRATETPNFNDRVERSASRDIV
jgi:hypothetical protein